MTSSGRANCTKRLRSSRNVVVVMLLAAALAPAERAVAQESRPARWSVDTSAAVDTTVSADGEATTGITGDALVSFEFAPDLQFVTRPFLQRVGASGEWNAQVWLAALRYEHAAKLAVRIDAGYIPSPVGMANLLLRPNSNPTIALPSSLFASLPLVDVGGPRTPLLGATYPLGVSGTVSSLRWDIRAAAIDSSPMRPRRVFADQSPANPPRFPQVTFGGGVTPVVGVRLGASITRGHWERAGESPSASQDRIATTATVEADVSYAHTRVQGEWTRDRFSIDTGSIVASGWFVQGMQTLAPRWFVAARAERMSAPAIVTAPTVFNVTRQPQHLEGFEATVGYRINSDLTLRASHRLRKLFGREEFDRTTAVSIVWWKRWL